MIYFGGKVMTNWNAIWSSVNGVWLGGTPNSDNGTFPNGVNKGKGLGGDDHIRGNNSANVIFGNNGDDFLRGDGGDDSLNGGRGNDILLGDELDDLDQGDDLLEGGDGKDFLIGAGGDDALYGGADDDIALGGDGRDKLFGGDGDDALIGGLGDDHIFGGAGDDILTGNLGDDNLRGGAGRDWISGGRGEDTIYGNGGDDALCGNSGHDYLNGGAGDDYVSGGSGDDTLIGGNGNDTLLGGADDDVLRGGRGDDLIHGDSTIPGLHGGGHDNIQGGAGDDTIYGGDGDDRIEGNDNSDFIHGGAGDDIIWGDNADGDPAMGEASDMIDGGSGNDTIYGGEDDDQIRGGDDNDLIYGGTGNDTLRGDDGRDVIHGDDGDDHISGDDGNDILHGGDGDDVMSGGNGHDRMFGGDGDDCLDGGRGRDILKGGDGNDRLSGGTQNDQLFGGRGEDFLKGDEGDDTLMGGGHDDTLLGGEGDDSLDGGSGDDLLIGGSGDDTLRGGSGGDDFAFGHGVDEDGDGICDETFLTIGHNTIVDFDVDNNDRIFIHSALAGPNGSNLAATVSGKDVIVEILSTGETITIVGLVDELEGIDPDDPFFNPANLMPMLLKTGEVEDDGKGVITIGDVCVGDFACVVDLPQIRWTDPLIVDPDPKRVALMDEKVGNTTNNTTQQEMAAIYVEDDANVKNEGDALLFEICASNPPTIEVTDPVGFVEDLDASAQRLFQQGTISFDDVDETDTIALSFGNNAIPVWSAGLSLDLVDPTLFQALIDGFSFPETVDVDPPGSVPWTYDLTANLDFLALGETITWAYEIFVIDSEGTQTSDIIEFSITGTNDAPTIDAEESVVFVEGSNADAQLLAHSSTLDHDDLDFTDLVDLRIESNDDIAWSGGVLDAGLAKRLENGAGIDGSFILDTATPGTVPWNYGQFGNVIEDLDFLREGETITWSYTFSVTDPHGASDSDIVDFTITGTNDRPEAQDLAFTLSEDDSSAAVDDAANINGYAPLTGTPLTESFVVTDDDVNDLHTFEIVGLTEISPGVYQTVDNMGFEYGKLYNNGDGTFTFDPEDDFQHLDAGEFRTVVFEYQARDDSGAGESPAGPSESELSATQTVTLTIEGEDDADQVEEDTLLFTTAGQSIWNTGDAFSLNPDLPFLGFDTGYRSLDATIIPDWNVSAGAVGTVLEGLEAVGEWFANAGQDIIDFFTGNDTQDIDLNIRDIVIPGLSTNGFVDAKVGVQPYFFLNGGELGAEIPVDVVFTAPRQVEQGETINIGSAFTVDGGATFTTDGPSVQFGLDFIFDVAAELGFNIFGSNIDLFDFDSSDFLGTGVTGETGFNIFDFSPGDDVEFPLPGGTTVTLTNPDFGVNGSPVNPPSNTRLEGIDSEEFVDLTLDIDGIISAITPLPPLEGGGTQGFSLGFGDVGSINVASFTYEWNLFDVELQGILSGIQDFALEITDLPLMAVLEDGVTTITGFSVGDDITFDVPLETDFDVDTDGDADGLMDFDIQIDMEAVFENLTELGLDMNLILGFLKFTAGFSSDFVSDVDFSLFDSGSDEFDFGLIPSLPFDPDPNDGFLIGGTIPLIEDATLATLFDDQFDVEGWNNPQTTGFEFDVA